jgi:hypothetical protein
VKLGRADRIREEGERYREYIDGFLLGRFYARLDGHETFWDVGGLVYDFLGSTGRTAILSFDAFYERTSDVQDVLKPLRHLFEEVWSQSYRRSQPYEVSSLFEAYDQLFRLEPRLLAFANHDKENVFPGISSPLINPVAWVLRHKNDSVVSGSRQAITHGDLHAANILVDGTRSWAIDFAKSGPGPILKDYTGLEVDIVTRLVRSSENDLATLYELGIVLASPLTPLPELKPTTRITHNPQAAKALSVIAGLRRLAYEVTGYRDFREYLWGLVLDSLLVVCEASEATLRRNRALLFASVIAGRLKHWNREWPPKDWPPVRMLLRDKAGLEWRRDSLLRQLREFPGEESRIKQELAEVELELSLHESSKEPLLALRNEDEAQLDR